jgi:hypothetical protein
MMTSDDGNRISEKIIEHLSIPTDTIILLLKGHLIVEEQINWVLEGILARPDALRGGRFSFSQRLRIVSAVHAIPFNENILAAAAEELNAIRNRLAHHLDPGDLDKLLEEFIFKEAIWAPYTAVEGTSSQYHFATCIAAICGGLGEYRSAARFLSFPRIVEVMAKISPPVSDETPPMPRSDER